MSQNIAKIDRVIRLLIGLSVLIAGLTAPSWWGLLGVYPLLTAIGGWCPLYLPFRNTRQTTT